MQSVTGQCRIIKFEGGTCCATDIKGTFAEDATKKLTTGSKYVFEAVNAGAERLNERWMWHCRPTGNTTALCRKAYNEVRWFASAGATRQICRTEAK